MDPTVKYGLLTAPTAVDALLSSYFAGFAKLVGKIVPNISKYEEPSLSELYANELEEEGSKLKVEEKGSELEDMVDTSVARKVAKSVVRTGTLTTIGYSLGYTSAKLLH